MFIVLAYSLIIVCVTHLKMANKTRDDFLEHFVKNNSYFLVNHLFISLDILGLKLCSKIMFYVMIYKVEVVRAVRSIEAVVEIILHCEI